jgi:3-oxoacyl-[acyl-carrier protein] reductase
MRMQGKVALITGAGSGIGRASALRLSKEGARIACVDAVADAALDTARAITAAGGDAITLSADVSDEAACARMVQETLARFGRLTSLVNSAGVRSDPPTHAGVARVATCSGCKSHRQLPGVAGSPPALTRVVPLR